MTMHLLWTDTSFFFNDTATTEIYTLSLHDALPISARVRNVLTARPLGPPPTTIVSVLMSAGSAPRPTGPLRPTYRPPRSEEHTSELQSRQYLVCRLLLEKKNNTPDSTTPAAVSFSS